MLFFCFPVNMCYSILYAFLMFLSVCVCVCVCVRVHACVVFIIEISEAVWFVFSSVSDCIKYSLLLFL